MPYQCWWRKEFITFFWSKAEIAVLCITFSFSQHNIYKVYTSMSGDDIMNKKSKGGVPMTTTAQKWGGSTGVRIPHHLAKKYNIAPGTRIQVTDDGEKIVLKPEENKPTLEELVAKCTPENSHEEIDFGGPTGRELI